MQTLRETVRWVWWGVSVAHCICALLAWVELRRKKERTFHYLSRTQIGDAWRASVSIIGLLMFGLNVQQHTWFVIYGLCSAVFQAYAIISWLLYVRGTINGEGWLSLFKRRQ